MKMHILDRSRTIAFGVVLAAGLFTVSAQADGWDKKTVITINQPMQIADTLLQPGTYVLKLADSNSDRHVVQIYNADETKMINTILANAAMRQEPSSHSKFTYYETPPGNAQALRDWYYPGDVIGSEFTYPTNLKQLDTATTATTSEAIVDTKENITTPAVATPPVTNEPAPPAAAVTPVLPVEPPQPEPQLQPQTVPDTTPVPEPQVMDTTADNTANRAATPPELPKTASPYPLFGLCGLTLLGLGGLLRMRRTA